MPGTENANAEEIPPEQDVLSPEYLIATRKQQRGAAKKMRQRVSPMTTPNAKFETPNQGTKTPMKNNMNMNGGSENFSKASELTS